MGIITIARFLLCQRQAILDIAAGRHAIWLGLLFVFSAGFAREYDGEDLLHEPWHLLLPLAASLATATILFVVLWIVLHGWLTLPNEWRTFQTFVALYWMTAPLAWLYAIPAERFFTPSVALQVNLGLLWIVALWRVLLIIRVVTVIFKASVIRVLFPVMLFADSILIALIVFVPTPIVSLMGGIHLADVGRVISNLTLMAFNLGVITWWVWTIGSFVAFLIPRSQKVSSFTTLPELPVAHAAWRLAVASILVWLLIMPFTQPQQHRRRKADELMEREQIGEALAYMSRYQRGDFPPHWQPPPQPSQNISLEDVVDELKKEPEVAAWVKKAYQRRLRELNGQFDLLPDEM